MSPIPLMSQHAQMSQRSQSQTQSQQVTQRSDLGLKNQGHCRKRSFDPRSFNSNFSPFDYRNAIQTNKNTERPNIPALKVPTIRNRRSSHVPAVCHGLNINFSGRSSQQQQQRQSPIINMNQSPPIINPTKTPYQNKFPVGMPNSPITPNVNKFLSTNK